MKNEEFQTAVDIYAISTQKAKVATIISFLAASQFAALLAAHLRSSRVIGHDPIPVSTHVLPYTGKVLYGVGTYLRSTV